MNPEIERVIKKIAQIPRDFSTLKNISTINLLKESGYYDSHDQITVTDIIDVLKRDSNLIADWLLWSDDQRSTTTIYFTKGEEWCFIGHLPYDRNFTEINTKDEFFACASFIKLQVERLRKL